MEKRRILYRLGSSGRDEWMYGLSQELQKSVNHIPFFQCTKFGYEYIKQRANEENILFQDDEAQIKTEKPDLEYLNAMEKKYNFNIWGYIEDVAVRRKRERKIPSHKVLIQYEHVIRGLDEFLDKNKITDFIVYGLASTIDIILLEMMKQKNINVIVLRASPLQRRFGFLTGLENHLSGVKENYHLFKENSLNKEEREEALKVLQKYQDGECKLDCVAKYKESRIDKIKRFSGKARKAIKHRQLPSDFRPFFWKIIQKSYDHMGFFENPVEGEKFVLFPLHKQPEASTLIFGKWHNNQLSVIENIVRSLPVNHKLYVKEHYSGYGNRNPSFYKEVKKYAGVRLISPHVNNIDLIKKTSLVITITGTTGWEAIMFQKPVIVLGNVFYDVFDCIKKVKDIKNLPTMVRELIDKKISSEERLVCIASLIKSTYPGLAALPPDCANTSSEDENMRLLAQGISNHVTKIILKQLIKRSN